MDLVDFSKAKIISPKLTPNDRRGWPGLFPYYAGYSVAFADELINSLEMPEGFLVYDPWNGSGATTFAAAKNGFRSLGRDINPVMHVVAKARHLRPIDCGSVTPLLANILKLASADKEEILENDLLLKRFSRRTGQSLRSIERAIRHYLLNEIKVSEYSSLEDMSPTAAFFYVSLFNVARNCVKSHQSTNPTWLKKASRQEKIDLASDSIFDLFERSTLFASLAILEGGDNSAGSTKITLQTLDASLGKKLPQKFDFALTSPPYCTRIDYTAATEVELALISKAFPVDYDGMRRSMMGSVLSPKTVGSAETFWGETCNRFLESVREHPSKASSGYYYRTNLDYFRKLGASISALSRSAKRGAGVVVVAQDSYYKNIHNNLPQVITEMAEACGLQLLRKEDFAAKNIMASKHKYVRCYREKIQATESVLCYRKVY